MSDSFPTLRELRVHPVRVPIAEPHGTASGVITESPLVLTDVVTNSGITGHSIVFTYTTAALKPTADGWNPILAHPLRIERGIEQLSESIDAGVERDEAAVQRHSE